MDFHEYESPLLQRPQASSDPSPEVVHFSSPKESSRKGKIPILEDKEVLQNLENKAEKIQQAVLQKTKEAENEIKEKVKKVKKEHPSLDGFCAGINSCLKGCFCALTNYNLKEPYVKFLNTYTRVLLVLYGLSLGIGLFSYPLWNAIGVWKTGVIFSYFSLVSLWAHSIATKFSPNIQTELFLAELKTIDSNKAEKMKSKIESKEYDSRWLYAIQDDFEKSWHFSWKYAGFVACFIIPFVGHWITYLGNLWLVSQSLAWNLLNVYTVSYKQKNLKQTKEWMHRNRWPIFGFSLAVTLMTSTPVIGPFFIVPAQAAAAHLYNDMLRGPKQRTPPVH